MANCKYVLTKKDGDVVEFQNEAELDRYLEYQILFDSTTPFSKDFPKIRQDIENKIRNKTSKAFLRKKKDGEDVHEYSDSKGNTYKSMTEYIKDPDKGWLLQFKKEEYKENTYLKTANELIDGANFKDVIQITGEDKVKVDKWYDELFVQWDRAPFYGNHIDDLFNKAVDFFNTNKKSKRSDYIDYVINKGDFADRTVARTIAEQLWGTMEQVIDNSGKNVVLLSQQVLTDSGIAGSPDLLAVVLDSNKNPKRIDVYDLKTSFKELTDWGEGEKLKSYVYQTTGYARMIQRMFADDYQLESPHIHLLAHQLEISDNPSNKKSDIRGLGKLIDFNVRTSATDMYIEATNNFDEVLPEKEVTVKPTDFKPVATDIKELMEEYFNFSPFNEIRYRTKDKEFLTRTGVLFTNSEGNYVLRDYAGKSPQSFKPTQEKELEKAIEQYNKGYAEYLRNLGGGVIDFINKRRKDPADRDVKGFKHPSYYSNRQDVIKNYDAALKKYIEDVNWVPLNTDKEVSKELVDMGIILMYNPKIGKVDIIVASDYDLKANHKGELGTTLAGQYKTDANVKDLSKMTYGNLELIKGALYAFTQDAVFNEDKDITVGKVVAMSGKSLPTFDYVHDLIEDVKKVRKYSNNTSVIINVEDDTRIKNIYTDILSDTIDSLIGITSSEYFDDELDAEFVKEVFGRKVDARSQIYKGLVDIKENGDREEQIEYLEKLISKIKNTRLKRLQSAENNRIHKAVDLNRLLGELTSAILYLKSGRLKDEKDFKQMFMYDMTPDKMSSPIAKAVVDTVNSAVSKTNEAFTNFIRKEYKELAVIKERLIQENYSGGQAAAFLIGTHDNVIYNNMYDVDQDGKRTMYFKDPESPNLDLSPTEREYLTKYLKILNTVRIEKYSKLRPDLAAEFRDKQSLRRLEVPLMRASGQSTMLQEGIVEYVKDQTERYLTDLKSFTFDSEAIEEEKGEHYKVFDYFSRNDQSHQRDKTLSNTRPEEFESNLEYILLDYKVGALKKEYYDKALDDISTVSLALAHHRLNTVTNLKNTEAWITQFPDRVLLSRKDFGTENPKLVKALATLQKVSSFGIIALNPFSGTTAFMSNFFAVASATISKNQVLNDKLFGVKDLTIASGYMARYIENTVSNDNLVENLNRTYRISNMDKYNLVNNLKDRRGIMKWTSRIFYWFNSAPDYYWRMSIMLAQMNKDGVLDAHDSKGNYDYKKDKRISAFINKTAPESSSEYKEAKAFYNFLITQLKKENVGGVEVIDGMEVPTKAYTETMSNSVVKYANALMGDYDEQKKGIWANWVFGRMLMQFHVFMLAKRDIWFKKKYKYTFSQPKKVRGTFNEDRLFTPDPSGDDYIYEYEDTYAEGVLNSMFHFFQSFRGNLIESDIEGYKKYVEAAKQSREDFGKWRTAGLMHGMSDLLMMAFLLAISRLLEEEKGKGSWVTDNLIRSFNNAYKDLNPINIAKDLGFSDRMPFPTISYMIRLQEQFFQTLAGDREAYKFVFGNLGVTRPFMPIIDDAFGK